MTSRQVDYLPLSYLKSKHLRKFYTADKVIVYFQWTFYRSKASSANSVVIK